MTQEDKELLLKDLCARLPYGVKLGFYASATKQTYICTLLGLEPQEDEPVIAKTENGSFYMLAGNVKPYLFPMSSMTEEQKEEYHYITNYISPDDTEVWAEDEFIYVNQIEQLLHFYHTNHLDYRGLIPKGLALDATGLNIY